VELVTVRPIVDTKYDDESMKQRYTGWMTMAMKFEDDDRCFGHPIFRSMSWMMRLPITSADFLVDCIAAL
jgi:hypothetical protein